MSNEQIITIDEGENEGVTDRETIVEEKPQKDPFEVLDNLTMHPTMIFAKVLSKEKTPAGIIIPESAQDKELTPLVQILLVGEDVTVCQQKDYAYINPSYINFAKFNGIEGVVLMQDSVLATFDEIEEETNED